MLLELYSFLGSDASGAIKHACSEKVKQKKTVKCAFVSDLSNSYHLLFLWIVKFERIVNELRFMPTLIKAW